MIDLTWMDRLLRRWRRGPAARMPEAGEQGGAVVGTTVDGARVVVPEPRLETSGHGVVLGATGCGKSTMLARQLVDELRTSRDNGQGGMALVVIDGKNDLADLVAAGISAEIPEALPHLSILDPFTTSAFGLNLAKLEHAHVPLDVRAQVLTELVSATSATNGGAGVAAGARQRDVLFHVLLATLAMDHPARSPLLALDALMIPNGLALLGAVTRDVRARQWCHSASLSEELRVSTTARLRTAFAMTASVERMFGEECIDVAGLLRPGHVTLVRLGKPFGGLLSLTAFFAGLITRLIADVLLARPSPAEGLPHVRVVVDESHLVASALADISEVFLTTLRSRNGSLIQATQSPALFEAASSTMFRVTMTNARTKLVGRLSAQDADLIARERAPEPGTDESPAQVRARFGASLTRLKEREFFLLQPGGGSRRFRAAAVDVNGWNRARKAESEALRIAGERHALAMPPIRRPMLHELVSADADSTVAPAQSRKRRGPRGSRHVAEAADAPKEATSTPRAGGRRPLSKWG